LSLSLSWLFFFAPGRPGANDILAPGPAAAPRPPHWHWALSGAPGHGHRQVSHGPEDEA